MLTEIGSFDGHHSIFAMQGHSKATGFLDLLDDKSSTTVETRGGEAHKPCILPDSRVPHIVIMINGRVHRVSPRIRLDWFPE